MNIPVLEETTKKSLNGTMQFPQVVKALIGEGVESYRVDLIKMEKTFYRPDGKTHVEKFEYEPPVIAGEFDAAEVTAAIRASQAQQIGYPEFLARVMRAGTTNYTVFLDGRKAIYTGRKGDFHVENFPQ